MHLVGAVGGPQGAQIRPRLGEREVLGNAAAPVDLDGAVDDLQQILGIANLMPEISIRAPRCRPCPLTTTSAAAERVATVVELMALSLQARGPRRTETPKKRAHLGDDPFRPPGRYLSRDRHRRPPQSLGFGRWRAQPNRRPTAKSSVTAGSGGWSRQRSSGASRPGSRRSPRFCSSARKRILCHGWCRGRGHQRRHRDRRRDAIEEDRPPGIWGAHAARRRPRAVRRPADPRRPQRLADSDLGGARLRHRPGGPPDVVARAQSLPRRAG